MYFDKLNDIVDKYNNIYHKINKMNPIDVKSRKVLRYHVMRSKDYVKIDIKLHKKKHKLTDTNH